MNIVQDTLLLALNNRLSQHAINNLYNWFPLKHYLYSKLAKRIKIAVPQLIQHGGLVFLAEELM